MKSIELTSGELAIVSDEDYEYLNQFTWTGWRPRQCTYAVSGLNGGRGSWALMHRIVAKRIGWDAQGNITIDHKDGNGLNNIRANLRLATRAQQSYNKPPQKGKLYSPYKGVTWFLRDSKWKAQIMKNGKNFHLGYFEDELEAALAYDKAAKELFNEFARTNF